MMQRGPKRQSADAKKLAGTYKESRDKPVHLVNETSLPKAPAYLTPEAKVIWHEEIERVTKAGTCELDSSLFARYCSLEANCRDQFNAGETPRSAFLSELRKTGELLGIAGAPSRAQRGKAPDPVVNPFAALSRP